jgi:hypothetical protein
MGVIVEAENYRTEFHPEFEALKQTHFPHDPDDEPLILHSFRVLLNPDVERAFNEDFLRFISEQAYFIIGVVIDKKSHRARYGAAAFHPYNYCLSVMLERYRGFLDHFGGKGDVLAESRGAKEDRLLKKTYSDVWEDGTYYWRPRFFQKVLSSREIKLKPKNKNIAGTQLADLLAYPIKQEILLDNNQIASISGTFGEKICGAVRPKYNRQFYQGRIKGYGKVFLP